MAVADAMASAPAQARHLLHLTPAVPDFQVFDVDANFRLLADELRRHGVEVAAHQNR